MQELIAEDVTESLTSSVKQSFIEGTCVRRCLWLVVFAASVLLATMDRASAVTLTVYQSEASFLAATTGATLLDFNSFPMQAISGTEFQSQGFIFAPDPPIQGTGPDPGANTRCVMRPAAGTHAARPRLSDDFTVVIISRNRAGDLGIEEDCRSMARRAVRAKKNS